MNALDVQTSAGPISFVGRLHSDMARPSLLAIGGAFPPPENLHWLAKRFSGANVLVTQTTELPVRPATDVIRGLEEAAGLLMPGLPLVVLGVSTGALFALGMRSKSICHRIAVEPFLTTGELWPFVQNARERMIKYTDPLLKTFFWDLFGIGPDAFEPRDYRSLVDGIAEPTDVFVGAEPLMPERPVPRWPSFTSESDRQLLRGHPQVKVHVGPEGSGHEYGTVGDGMHAIRIATHAGLREAAARCQPGPLRP